MSRPEHTAPPEVFYNQDEASKYTSNSRIAAIQAEMTYRALELLALPPGESCYILDIGCGSGLSGEVLEEEGHVWVGMDISDSMLHVALERQKDDDSSEEEESDEENDDDEDSGMDTTGEGSSKGKKKSTIGHWDLFHQDIGQGVGFRPGVFDGAISISVIQWLCNADKTGHVPRRRLMRFFSTLYTSLSRGARAVFQFYPENPDQVEMIVSCAMKCGFSGGLVVDYPNSTKAKKYFLCLFAGYANDPSAAPRLPSALGEDGEEPPSSIAYERKRELRRKHRRSQPRKPIKGDKDWIARKKDLNKLRGKKVPLDSKYTGRKRRAKF
ncbi:Williams Beuren syndrome chromosome region 22 protein [Quaeritorhiza haematococci]|nr:Williams Beuren syndrome chromosome region 22 protein [Quaeritorhiza haematococci]